MAASIELRDGDLIVHIHGWDALRALRTSVRIPLAHVTGARAQPREAYFDDVIVNTPLGIGVYVPGDYAVGTLYLRDGRSFFDVHDPKKTIAIDLRNEDLQHLVVELEDESPEEAVLRVENAIA
jgi:hypothetical protein